MRVGGLISYTSLTPPVFDLDLNEIITVYIEFVFMESTEYNTQKFSFYTMGFWKTSTTLKRGEYSRDKF